MTKFIAFFGLSLMLLACNSNNTVDSKQVDNVRGDNVSQAPKYAIVIHGGAGVIKRENMSSKKDSIYRIALTEALAIGEDVLKSGGHAMDAVERVINYMEDAPIFNAGKGAVFTNNGENEMDASIMRGSDLEAGAVGGVKHIKHPISAAKAVLEQSEHVFLVGDGAEAFAKTVNLEFVDPTYFKTESRWNSLQVIKAKEKEIGMNDSVFRDSKFGTVGCVALDASGEIVAGTSTGGMTNKRFNRIGDSPVIGAGTYANNQTCGVSCTGHGEYFIRYAVAHDVSAMMSYKNISLEEASSYIVLKKLKEAGGSGGLVALDNMGNVAMPFNTEGMYRAYAKPNEKFIGIYKDEHPNKK